MAVVGIIALVLVGIVILTALVIGLRSLSDITRYFRLRRM